MLSPSVNLNRRSNVGIETDRQSVKERSLNHNIMFNYKLLFVTEITENKEISWQWPPNKEFRAVEAQLREVLGVF